MSDKERMTAERLRERYAWKEVQVPKVWRPEPGEELVGFYGGRTLKNGIYGQYEVALVHVPFKGAYTVSGTGLIQLLDTGMVAKGHPVRILFEGKKDLGDDMEKKMFTLFAVDLDAIDEADLPRVNQ